MVYIMGYTVKSKNRNINITVKLKKAITLTSFCLMRIKEREKNPDVIFLPLGFCATADITPEVVMKKLNDTAKRVPFTEKLFTPYR